jgi:hypothetical protein
MQTARADVEALSDRESFVSNPLLFHSVVIVGCEAPVGSEAPVGCDFFSL